MFDADLLDEILGREALERAVQTPHGDIGPQRDMFLLG
jgi:hypothetical protein